MWDTQATMPQQHRATLTASHQGGCVLAVPTELILLPSHSWGQPAVLPSDPHCPTSIMHSLRARSFFPLLLLDPFRPKSTDGAEPRAGSDGFVPGMNLQLSAVTAPELPTFQTASAHDPPSKANPCRALHPVLGIPHRGGSSQASLPLCPKHRVGFTSSKGPRVPSCSHAALHTSFFPWREAG